MEKRMDLNGLFNTLFASVTSVPELKEAANVICGQVKTAFEARIKELAEEGGEIKLKPTTKGKTAAKMAHDKVVSKKAKAAQTKAAKAKAETPKTAEAPKVKEETAKPKVEQVAISSLTKAQIKAMNIKFEKYTDKCYFMTGETRSISQDIAKIGGATWNRTRQGWFVKNDIAKILAKSFGMKLA